MEGLVLGCDLCNDYCQISCWNPERGEPEAVELTQGSSMISTVICRRRGKEAWLVGEAGYRCALMGEGVIVDKLIRLAGKRGTATIEGVCYSAQQLLTQFLREILEISFQKYGVREIQAITFTLRNLDREVIDAVLEAAVSLGIDRDRVRLVSHTESFLYFSVSQRKDLWASLCGLFDLNEEGLHYYDMTVLRGIKPQAVQARHEPLEEGFRLDILDSPAGEKLGDTILCSCAQRLMEKKLYSSVFLTGKGFEGCEKWAVTFTKWLCSRRKVYMEPSLFAKGAALIAADGLREKTAYPYCFLCEGRIGATVSMEVSDRGTKKRLILAEAGSNWYETRSSVEVIPDNKGELEVTVTPVGSAAGRKITLPLDEFPARPNKTTRIEIVTSFSSEKLMTVRVIDKGFGEFFPATGQMLRQEIHL